MVIAMLKAVGCGVVWALGLASFAAPSVARAQEAEEAQEADETTSASAQEARTEAPHEAFQLSLLGSLVDYQKQTLKLEQPSGSSMALGDQESTTTAFGVLGSGFGVGFGYAWDQVLLGAHAQMTSKTTSPAGGVEDKSTTLELSPRVEYMFDTGSTRPYIAGLLGLLHESSSHALSGSDGSGSSESSSTRFGFGAAFGLHAFLNRGASIDPEFAVLYSAGSGSDTVASTGSLPASTSVDSSVSALRLMLTLGLSAWIDTGGAPPPAAPRESDAAPPPSAVAPAIVEPEPAPLSADIHLPNHRKLYLQVLKDPAQPYVLARLTEPRDRFALSKCDDVSIVESASLTKLAIRTHGNHYLTGRLPVRGAEVLAGIVDSNISVCGEQWLLGQESREQVQVFLKARRQLIDDSGDDAAETQPVQLEPPAPAEAPSVAPNAAPSAPNAAPSAPNAAPSAPVGPNAAPVAPKK